MRQDDEIKYIVKKNLLDLYSRIPHAPQQKIAEVCGVTKQAVNKWTAPKNSVPSQRNMKAISKYFHLPADWLISDHSMDDIFNLVIFYNDAFIQLKPLIDNGTFLVSDIKDPILQYLEGQAQLYLNDPDVLNQDKTNWLKCVTEKFFYRMPLLTDIDIWNMIIKKEHSKIYNSTDEMQRYSNLARVIDQYYDRIQPLSTDEKTLNYKIDSKNIDFLL